MDQATPNWQPISALPMVASFIDGIITDTGAQWETLRSVRHRPHVLDAALVERIQRVCAEQSETAALFKEQLARWRTQRLSPERAEAIARLEKQVEQLQTNLTNILDLADEVKDKTIDQILEKSDFDLGLECLLGKHRL